MSKKLFTLSMAFMLAFTTMLSMTFTSIFTTQTTEAATTYSEVKLKVHYHRFDKNYEGWNLWIWPDGKEGKALQFTQDDAFGKLASITLPDMKDITKIGFIVRYSQPGGDEWKDREFGDRYITNISADGDAEIWLVQDQEKVFTKESEADLSPRVARAAIDTPNKLSFSLNVPFKPTGSGSEGFVLKAGATELPIVSFEATPDANGNVRKGTLTTKDKLDLNTDYMLSRTGYKEAKVIMGNIFSSKEFETQFTYTGSDLGLTYNSANSKFRLWAPTASDVKLNIYDTYNQLTPTATAMTKAEKGTWTATLNGNLKGKFYTYEVTVNGIVNEAVDPYARAVSVNGQKAAIIDLNDTNPDGWLDQPKPPFGNATDAVIYELHVRDFSIHPQSGIKNKGKFLAFTEENTKSPKGTPTGLSYIKDLGVTHVQLLPIYDYATVDETKLDQPQYNWGYDPKNWNAPEGSYSTDPTKPEVRIKELKQAIQSMHANGLRVIMDVVYNHVYNLDPSNTNKIVPGYYFRYKEDGSPANGTGVGNETASERSMMRKLIVDSTNYWAKEYKLDGYRFDLMGIHDITTMNKVRSDMTKIDPNFVVLGEGWVMGNSLDDKLKANQMNAPLMPSIAHFNDYIRDGVKGSVWNDGDRGWVNGNLSAADKVKGGIAGGIQMNGIALQFTKTPDQSVTYVEAHDNLTLWDKLEKTSGELPEVVRINMHKLASTIALTSQGVAFIHAGQEFLRTKGGDHNSYKSPDSVNQMDWSRKDKYSDVVDYFKGLIELRKTHPAFRMMNSADVRNNLKFLPDQEGVIAYTLNGKALGDSWDTIAVVHNANTKAKSIKLPLSGSWNVVVNGDQAGVASLESFEGSTIEVSGLSTKIMYLDGDAQAPTDNVDNENEVVDNSGTESGSKGDSDSGKTYTRTDVSSNTRNDSSSSSSSTQSTEEENAEVVDPETVETGEETGEPGITDTENNSNNELGSGSDGDKDKKGKKEESSVVMWMMIGVTVTALLVLGLFILIIRRSTRK